MPHHYTPRDIDRFWSKVDKSGDCWEWQGARHRQGYGSAYHGHKIVMAHRLVYELTYGPVPEGLSVLHRCDNPPCVRPDHLFLGTQSDNVRDMCCKGRHGMILHPELIPRGEQIGTAILTEQQVLTIRREYAGGVTQMALVRIYNVSLSTIRDIIKGKTWRHLL